MARRDIAHLRDITCKLNKAHLAGVPRETRLTILFPFFGRGEGWGLSVGNDKRAGGGADSDTGRKLRVDTN